MTNSWADQLFYLICGVMLALLGLRFFLGIYFLQRRTLKKPGLKLHMIGWFIWSLSCFIKFYEIAHPIPGRAPSDAVGLIGSLLTLIGAFRYLKDRYKNNHWLT